MSMEIYTNVYAQPTRYVCPYREGIINDKLSFIAYQWIGADVAVDSELMLKDENASDLASVILRSAF